MISGDQQSAKSYIAHEEHMKSLIHEKDQRLFLLKNKNCVAYLLSIRTLEILKPLFDSKSTWLTIGDYNGFEAKYLIDHKQHAVASDISDAFLKEAHNEGLIREYLKINVEHIDLNENSFDYVSCREAFHHFPRAYLGLYEMIRVAKKGVIVTEAIDILAKMPIVLLIKNICDRIDPYLINKIWKNRFSWETVGNYVFKLSEREIEKIAMGMGLPCIAFKQVNKLQDIKGDTLKTPVDQKLMDKLDLRLHFINFMGKIGVIPYNSFCSIIFKESPDKELKIKLKEEGFKIIELPPNPYLK